MLAPALRFLVVGGYEQPVNDLRAHWGEALPVAADVLPYARVLASVSRGPRRRLHERRLLGRSGALRPRVYVFSDLERLAPRDRARAARVWQHLGRLPEAPRRLNDPARSLTRHDLLRSLHACGQNAFDVYRAAEAAMPKRFPVFLRRENDHKGPRSGLIETPEVLAAELRRLEAAGERRERLLVVEFCDTREADGRVRKYGAFRVGDAIVPRHVFVSRHWMVKEAPEGDAAEAAAALAEELAWLEAFPHAAELRRLFDHAAIEYGRIDYGVKDGRIQVWEINTNPTVLLERHLRGVRAEVHRLFARRFAQAVRELVGRA
jgi:hypothetical protein